MMAILGASNGERMKKNTTRIFLAILYKWTLP